jgi:exosortase K
MKQKVNWNRVAQWVVTVLCAFLLKQFYSTASVDDLRWILAPTAALVEIVTGRSFEFESHAGYMSEDRTFLIATSCAGVNFLIAAFLMLSISRRRGKLDGGWVFLPVAGLIAYLGAVIANTARISVALLAGSASETGWLDREQLHRLEGVLVYFGFLLLLFVISERASSGAAGSFRRCLIPLLAYYAVVIGIPLANGAYGRGWEFWEHTLFVLLIPVALTLLVVPVMGEDYQSGGGASQQPFHQAAALEWKGEPES